MTTGMNSTTHKTAVLSSHHSTGRTVHTHLIQFPEVANFKTLTQENESSDQRLPQVRNEYKKQKKIDRYQPQSGGVLDSPLLKTKQHFRAASTRLGNQGNEVFQSLSLFGPKNQNQNRPQELCQSVDLGMKLKSVKQRAHYLVTSSPEELKNKGKEDFYSKYKVKRQDVRRMQQSLAIQTNTESTRILFQESQIEETAPTQASVKKDDELLQALRQALTQVDSSLDMVNYSPFQYVMSPTEKAAFKQQQQFLKLKEKLQPTSEAKESKKRQMAKSLVTSLIGPLANKPQFVISKKVIADSPTGSPKFQRSKGLILKDMSIQKVEAARSTMQSVDLSSKYSEHINTSSSRFLKGKNHSPTDNILSKAMKQELNALKSNAQLVAQQESDYIPHMEHKSLKFLRQQDTSRNSILRIESSQRIVSVASIHSMVSGGNHNAHKRAYKSKDLQDLRVTIENRLANELREGGLSPTSLKRIRHSPTRNSMLKLLTDNQRLKMTDKLTTKLKLNDDGSDGSINFKDRQSKNSDSTVSMQKIKYKSQFQRVDSQALISQRLQAGLRPPKKFKIETSDEKGNDDLKALFKAEAAIERRQLQEMKERQFKRPKNAAPKISATLKAESTFPTMVTGGDDEPNDQIRKSLLRLFNYQVAQLDEEAMLSPEARESLYQHIKTKTRAEQQKLLRQHDDQPISSAFKSYLRTLEQQQDLDASDEKLKRECLFAFKNQDGTLKTDKSLKKLIQDELETIRILEAATTPHHEEASYKAAAKHLFQKDELSYFNSELKKHIPIPTSQIELNEQSAMALLYRKDIAKDPLKLQLAENLAQYVEELQQQSKRDSDIKAKRKEKVHQLLTDHDALLPKLSSYGEINDIASTKTTDGPPLLKLQAVTKTHSSSDSNESNQSSFARQENFWYKYKSGMPPKMTKPLEIERFKEKAFDWNRLMDVMIEKFVIRDIALDLGTSRESKHAGDVRFVYFDECRKAIEPAKRLLSKIEAGRMMLQEFPVTEAMCRGVKRACELDPKLFKNFFADNCKITDAAFASLLDGMNKLQGINSLVIRRSEIGILSAPKLIPMMAKFYPNSLEELRIENCQISPESIAILLEGLVEKNYVRRFALVGVQFNRKCVDLLVEFINFSSYLEDLDLSMTRGLSGQLEPILEAISSKQALKLLNLSWNNLLAEYQTPCAQGTFLEKQPDNTYHQNPFSLGKPAFERGERNLMETRNSLKSLSSQVETDQNGAESCISGYICRLIDGNQKLQHLDLSDSGLSEQMLRDIAGAAAKSTSLLGIHFSGNPGLNSRTEKELTRFFNATWEPPLNKQTFSQFLGGKDETVDYRKCLMTKDLQQRLAATAPFEFGQASDQPRRHLIFTRVLGYEIEMPGSENWQMHKNHAKECWICDRRILTVILWSPQFGDHEQRKIQLSHDDRQVIFQKVFSERETSVRRYRQREVDKRLMTPDQRPAEQVLTTLEDDREDASYSMGDFSDVRSGSDSMSAFEESPPAHQMGTTLPDIRIESLPSQGGFSSQTVTKLNLTSHKPDRKPSSHNSSYIKIRTNASFTNPKTKELPMILGSFNNWQPQPMIRLNRYAELMETQPGPDIYQECKALKRLRPMITSVEEMTRREKQFFEERVELSRLRFNTSEVWSRVLGGNLKFKHPLVVGSSYAIHKTPQQIYVACALLSPGQNDFMVQQKNTVYLHQTAADLRQEQLPDLKPNLPK